MARLVMPENALNGGFPEPPSSAPVRVIEAHHDACGADTRVRLPGTVPARAVRRFHCASCASAFTARHVEEIELRLTGDAIAAPAAPRPVLVPKARPATKAEPANRPATKPETSEPQAAKPKVQKPTATKPKLDKPKPEPKVKKPKPKAYPEAKKREPAAAKPKRAPRPKRERRKISAPKLALPAFATRKLSMPKPALPAFAKREISLPKLSAPKLSKPKFAMPTLAKPKLAMPSIGKPATSRSFDPDSRTWRLLSIGVAALAVLAILLVVRGGDDAPAPSALPVASAAPAVAAKGDKGQGDGKASKPAKDTKFVSESSFSLALPAGWQRVDPPAGATFAAVAAEGGADATLWIKEDPKLDFPTFVSQSLTQLKTLAGSAQVTERIPAPTAEGTVVRLSADAPAGQPTYEVTLRVAGPYRYYLATTVQPNASTDIVDGVDLITGSFTPELGG